MKDLQIYPYFWLISQLFAKSRYKLVNLSCQLLYSILGLFPYFLYMKSIPASFLIFNFFIILVTMYALVMGHFARDFLLQYFNRQNHHMVVWPNNLPWHRSDDFFELSLHVSLSNADILKSTCPYESSNIVIRDLRALLRTCYVTRIKLTFKHSQVESLFEFNWCL